MKEITLYYAEGINQPFYNREEALAAESQLKEWMSKAIENSPQAKLELLKAELENCQYIPPETITTCSFASLVTKAMVKVCQKFAEENKQYLNYY